MNTSQKLSNEELHNLIDENPDNWKRLFSIMKENNLKFHNDEIQRKDDQETIYVMDPESADYLFLELLKDFYNYWLEHER